MLKIKLLLKKRIVFILIVITTCASCSLFGNTYISTSKEQRIIAEEILNYVSQDDTESLKNMFCKKVLDYHSSIDNDITEAMSFFDGSVTSYDKESRIYDSDEQVIENGKQVKIATSATIKNIKTEKNHIYTIKFYNYLIFEQHPDRVGISEIIITDEKGSVCKIGDFYLVNPEYE